MCFKFYVMLNLNHRGTYHPPRNSIFLGDIVTVTKKFLININTYPTMGDLSDSNESIYYFKSGKPCLIFSSGLRENPISCKYACVIIEGSLRSPGP